MLLAPLPLVLGGEVEDSGRDGARLKVPGADGGGF